MMWAVIIVVNLVFVIWNTRDIKRLQDRVDELEQADLARGFKEDSKSPWEDMDPIDKDLPDMSEEVTIDDLT